MYVNIYKWWDKLLHRAAHTADTARYIDPQSAAQANKLKPLAPYTYLLMRWVCSPQQ